MRASYNYLKRIVTSLKQFPNGILNSGHEFHYSKSLIDPYPTSIHQWPLNSVISRSARILPGRRKPALPPHEGLPEDELPQYARPPQRSPRFQQGEKGESDAPFTSEDFQWDFEARMDPDLGKVARQEAIDFMHYAAEQASGPLMDDPRNLRPPRALSEFCELVELSNPWRQTVKVRKGFSAGDLIIREEPLIFISDDTPDEAPLFLGKLKREILQEKFGLRNSAIAAPLRYIHGLFQFAHSPPEIKRKIMQLYSPDYPAMDPVGMAFLMFLLKRLEEDGHLKGMSLSLCVGVLMRLITHATLHDDKISVVHEVCGFVRHSCAPNCMLSFVEGSTDVELRPLVDLRAGDEITVAYTSELRYPRELRKQIINFIYHFDCDCSRCKDVDDMRAMQCRECTDGWVFLDDRRVKVFCSSCKAEMDKKVKDDLIQEELRVEEFFIKLEERLSQEAERQVAQNVKPYALDSDRVADYLDIDEALRLKANMEASGFAPRHWLMMLMDLVLLEAYKEKRDYAESARRIIHWLESMEQVSPVPAVNKALMYEELGDILIENPEVIGATETSRVLEMACRSYSRAKENLNIMFGKQHSWFGNVADKLQKAEKKTQTMLAPRTSQK